MKRVLITGCAGFIGFHLAKFLKKRGDFVIGLDNFNDYYDPSLKRLRAEQLEIIEGGLERCASILEEYQITHLVHLAAQAGVRYSITNPEPYIESNLVGFFHVIEAVRRFPHVKLTYASSSSVYGLNRTVPFSEEQITDQPANLYGATKKSNELMAFSYHNLYGISVTGLRFFTVYGPWGRPDMAYFSFTKALVDEKPIRVFGDGTMARDFTYIDDIIAGMVAALDLGSGCEIFNLGNERPVDILKMIAILEELTGKKGKLDFHPLPIGEIPITFADVSKAKEKLGFSPKTHLEDGLKTFVDWYMNIYHGSSLFIAPRA